MVGAVGDHGGWRGAKHNCSLGIFASWTTRFIFGSQSFFSLVLADSAFCLTGISKYPALQTANPDWAGCQFLKLRGLTPVAIWCTRKPAPTSHDSYWTLNSQICSCLHPLSFNSYCWSIWGIWFGIWDSFPILKEEKKKKHTLNPAILKAEILFHIFSFQCLMLLCSFCLLPILRWTAEMLKFKLHKYIHMKQSQRLCWFNIFLPTLPTSKENPLVAWHGKDYLCMTRLLPRSR